MSNLPLVSVIIPCYNHEKYLKQSILSVLNQTYKNIELIVIDDGSKDNSVEIIKNLQNFSGFKFITQENMGVCRTLNKGVMISTGKYIGVLASDDYWDITKIEKQVKVLESRDDSEFCFTQALEFDSNTGKELKIFPKKAISGYVLNRVFIRQHVPAGSMIFSRKLFDRLNGFDETLKEEDWDFVIRSAANTRFIGINESLFFYRSHETNIMKTRGRTEIFKQKVLLLTKNFSLISPLRWYFSISLHFFYDMIYKRGK
ncbi:MAG: glycosyltransferase [Arcobacteraceae bacterium]|jgi:alpha-1,3-rhamnosyltransferase|nr:glycosyltransferase [Arcobacteraceae bacterium]